MATSLRINRVHRRDQAIASRDDLSSTRALLPHYNGIVAQRPANPISVAFAEFDRAFDQLFEELLISRWRARAFKAALNDAAVLESETEYRVRIDASGADPERMEIEAADRRLLVRMAGPAGARTSTLEFSHSIDPDGVTARLAGGALEIVLPKKRGRRIAVR